MHYLSQRSREAKEKLVAHHSAHVITIPFENFVINPWSYLRTIEEMIGTKMTRWTKRMLKKQNIPRKMYAEGIRLPIYQTYGWQPPTSLGEQEEFRIRREFVKRLASEEAISVLDRLSSDYEKMYLSKGEIPQRQ